MDFSLAYYFFYIVPIALFAIFVFGLRVLFMLPDTQKITSSTFFESVALLRRPLKKNLAK